MSKQLQTAIDAAWEARDGINSATKGEVRDAVEAAIAGLDDGTYRTAEKFGDEWVVHQWLKKAVLLSFRLYDLVPMDGGASFPGMGAAPWFDKVPLKTTGWDAARFAKAGFRSVPGSVVRRGSSIAPSVVLMPSFVNLGAYVDTGTMVDTWATVGSCAQIGKNCHLSGGVGIGGVLEPLQANPVIIEDNCFIGARSEVVEGVIVGTGAVLVDGRVHQRHHQGGRSRHRPDPYRQGAAVLRRRARQHRRRPGSSLDLLRRDREDRRRAHPLQDLDQRTAARLGLRFFPFAESARGSALVLRGRWGPDPSAPADQRRKCPPTKQSK